MKEAWCLTASSPNESAQKLIACYGKRWEIACAFRDTKDLRLGMGTTRIRARTPERGDRLWLPGAFAVALPTLLGERGKLSAVTGS